MRRAESWIQMTSVPHEACLRLSPAHSWNLRAVSQEACAGCCHPAPHAPLCLVGTEDCDVGQVHPYRLSLQSSTMVKKELLYFKVHLQIIFQLSQSESLASCSSHLLVLNQQTVVQFQVQSCTDSSRVYSYRDLQQVQILPLFTNGLIKYLPPYLQASTTHATRHTLILAMLIAPFVYDLKSRRFHLSYHIDS